jgi:hypothetical protein
MPLGAWWELALTPSDRCLIGRKDSIFPRSWVSFESPKPDPRADAHLDPSRAKDGGEIQDFNKLATTIEAIPLASVHELARNPSCQMNSARHQAKFSPPSRDEFSPIAIS